MHSEYIFQISGAHMHSNRIGIWMDLSEFRQIIQGNQTHIHAILLEALLLLKKGHKRCPFSYVTHQSV